MLENRKRLQEIRLEMIEDIKTIGSISYIASEIGIKYQTLYNFIHRDREITNWKLYSTMKQIYKGIYKKDLILK